MVCKDRENREIGVNTFIPKNLAKWFPKIMWHKYILIERKIFINFISSRKAGLDTVVKFET